MRKRSSRSLYLAAVLVVSLAGGSAGLSRAQAHPAVSARSTRTVVARKARSTCPAAPVAPGTAVYGASARGAAAHEVALTFDDGPSASSSPAILSFLERTHTPATFFVIGQHAQQWPNLLQREARDGFVIGVHTWDHPDLTKLSSARISSELSSTESAIHRALGAGYCIRYFRPPYGSYNTRVLGQARALGLAAILWNVDPADWSRPGTQTIINRVLRQVRPGSIVLMHDGPSHREETAAALPSILAGLRARGLRPVTLTQLLADAASAPQATGGSASHTVAQQEHEPDNDADDRR